MEALQSIIGEDDQTRTMLLEMSGGDVETAVAIYFSMNEQPTESTNSSPPSGPSISLPEWHSLIWPSPDGPPESWLSQPLRFDNNGGLKLSQISNGPCGVLAAFQAAVIAQCHFQKIEAFFEQGPVIFEPSPQLIGQTLKNMLTLSNDSQVISIARWNNDNGEGEGGGEASGGGNIAIDELNVDDPNIQNILVRNLCVKGGCILLVISAVLTKGCSVVRNELNIEGVSSLVSKTTYICMMELVSLLLCGKATANILAYDPMTRIKKPAWRNELIQKDDSSLQTVSNMGVGLLSTHEYDGQPLADDLKCPSTPVWLLHGGDHFTVLFSTLQQQTNAHQNEDNSNNEPFANKPFYHWNGLKPNGPRMALLDITSPYIIQHAPQEIKMNYRKPQQGEIEDVVQGDKTSDNWREWKFEVILAVHEEEDYAEEKTISSTEKEENKKDDALQPPINVPVFDFNHYPPQEDQRWRCRNCYATRFKTMCFGLNEPTFNHDEVTCEHCGKFRKEVGHSFWLPFHELPSKWQEVVENRHGPKIIALLRTKWKSATINLIRNDDDACDALPGI